MRKENKNGRSLSLNEVESQKEITAATTKLENFVKRQVALNGDLYDLMPYIDQYLKDWKTKEKFVNVELVVWFSLILFVIISSIATKNINSAISSMFPILMFAYVIQWQAHELTDSFNYPQGALSKEAKRILEQLEKLYNYDSFSNDFSSIEKIFDNPEKIITIIQKTFVQENKSNEQAKIEASSITKPENAYIDENLKYDNDLLHFLDDDDENLAQM
jgi:hypothetical protein